MGTDFQQRLARIRGRVVEVVRENVSLKTENLALAQELEELKKTIALQKNALAELKDENLPFEKSVFASAIKKSIEDAIGKY